VLCGLATGAYAERRVFEGAIFSSRTPGKARASLTPSLVKLPKNFSVHPLRPQTLLLTDRQSRNKSAAFTSSDEPKPFTRKTNSCKRAKFRRIHRILTQMRCEPNYAQSITTTPNDPLFSSSYVNSQINLESAWDYSTGSESLLAVVIDSGIFHSHPDLQDNIWTNPGEIQSNGIDDDGNGVIDDYYGVNAITWGGPSTISSAGNPLDDHGHGTHCAGILGARGNNGTGAVGVNWQIKIVTAKFIASNGFGSTANAIKAVQYATLLKQAGHKVVVTNNSWGGGGYSQALLDAINAGANAGILFVAAAGNNATNNDSSPFYPSNYPSDGVLSVASTDQSSNLSYFSNYGESTVDIAAPGSEITSTYLDDQYAVTSGTSMAAPQVAGVAALTQSVCTHDRLLGPQQLRSLILSTGTSVANLSGKVASGSIVNAFEAAKGAYTTCGAGAPTSTPTATPSATQTNTATPIPPTSAPPTDSPTPIPSSTPTQAPPLPTSAPPPLPTFTPAPGTFPVQPPTTDEDVPVGLIASPSENLSAGSALTLRVTLPTSQKRATLRISGSDGRSTYFCPPVVISATTRTLNRSIEIPRITPRLRSLKVNAVLGGKLFEEEASFAGPIPTANRRKSLSYVRSLCSAVRNGLRTSSDARSR
jgi:subtilisin family serine protease